MNNEKKKSGSGGIILKVLLVLAVLIAITGAALYFWIGHEYAKYQEEQTQEIHTIVGQDVPDFTIQLTDGSETTVNRLLEDHEAVVVNVFATWCGPCKAEFPEFEKAYRKYGDKVTIVSVDPDSLDDLEAIKKFKEENGLSFPMGRVDRDSASMLNTPSYPTTYVIDRNGKICFCQMGVFLSGEMFEKVITAFTGDEYQEKHAALYTFVVMGRQNERVEGAQLILKSDTVEEILTTDESGAAYYYTENPEVIDVMVMSLPGSYTAQEGIVASTTGEISQIYVISVE